MTWELTTLASVLVICSTATIIVLWLFPDVPAAESDDEVEMLKTAIVQIKADHEAFQKVVEETKKLLSQENLAKSLGARR